MFPALAVPIRHLRLQKATESALDGPANSVALLHSALNNVLILGKTVDIDPDTILDNLIGLLSGMLVFLGFSAPWLTPKSFATSRCMFTESSCTYR